MPDLNIARIGASAIIISEFVYVFGGRNENGYVSAIERMNLKNLVSCFEVIEQ